MGVEGQLRLGNHGRTIEIHFPLHKFWELDMFDSDCPVLSCHGAAGLSWEICFEGGLTELAEEQCAMQHGFCRNIMQHYSGQL